MSIPLTTITALPKVELHRHLEGSLRVETLTDIARQYGIGLQKTDSLRPLVQVSEDQPYTAENFLSKFSTLRQFFKSPEIIQRITREAIQDAARDNVRYLELRFTPVALSKIEGFNLDDVIDWVIEATHKAEQEFAIRVRLIVSVNRHESVELAEQVVQLAIPRQKQGIAGLDLAGNETDFSAQPFLEVFQHAQQSGLNLTIHAGEWNKAENIAYAIETMNSARIGHGVRILEDPHVVELARSKRIPFEVCITSNYQSGVIATGLPHPLRAMLDAGLNVTINTDDPGICQVTLGDEIHRAHKELSLDLTQIRKTILAAASAAFLPEDEKSALIEALQKELSIFQS